MGLDEELETLEEEGQTEAEAAEDEIGLDSEDEFEDDELGPDAGEEDLEEVYEDFGKNEGRADLLDDEDEEDVDDLVDEEDVADSNLADEDEDIDEDEYEEVELELDEEDIESYLVDEDGNEVGFTLLDEEGNEVEYFYVEEELADDGEEPNEFDLGITKEGVARVTNDANAIYKDGVVIASELKGAFDDIKSAFDFKSVLKK